MFRTRLNQISPNFILKICTEWPMRSTQANFWSMVYDHDVRVVVVMDPVKNDSSGGGGSRKNESKHFDRFWPTTTTTPTANMNGKKDHASKDTGKTKTRDLGDGMFSVELDSHTKFSENIDCWTLKLKKLSLLNLR